VGWLRHPLVVAAVLLLSAAAAVVALQEPSAPPPEADLRNGRAFIQDNLWSTEDAQYAVWVAPDGTTFAGRRSLDGQWRRVDLSTIPGNPLAIPTEDDQHNVYAIAVDSLGYVHIAGNMHGDPLRYVRSSRPGDLESLAAGEMAGPGSRVTYPRFVALPDGTLLFFRREGGAGNGAIVLDTLEPGERAWRHVGAVLDGRPTEEGVYVHPAVDPWTGTVHVFFVWRGSPEPRTTNDVGYARSRDGGRTWETSDGRRLPAPITHPTAEILIDTHPRDSGLRSISLTVDREGNPHGMATFQVPDGGRRIEHLWHDGTRWQWTEVEASVIDGRPAIAAMDDGRLWLLGASGSDLVAVEVTSDGGGELRPIGRVPQRWEVAYDTQALIRRCRVEMLVPDGSEPRVVIADLAAHDASRGAAACALGGPRGQNRTVVAHGR
jgi:hypothetical protein